MQFGAQRALDALDVTVESGVTGLVGANGAGKTTLMSILLGLRTPTAGSATVLGLDPAHDGTRLRALVGYGPERNQFPEDMPASDFVKHLAEVRGMPKAEARARASDALWLVGLGEERFRALGTMSTGQRQRVKLAQAIAADPSLVFLDEPTDGLDPVQRDEMLALIRQISTAYGIDVVLSSHLLEEVERICDHVVALDAGRLIAQGPLADLIGNDTGVVVELVEVGGVPVEQLVADLLLAVVERDAVVGFVGTVGTVRTVAVQSFAEAQREVAVVVVLTGGVQHPREARPRACRRACARNGDASRRCRATRRPPRPRPWCRPS